MLEINEMAKVVINDVDKDGFVTYTTLGKQYKTHISDFAEWWDFKKFYVSNASKLKVAYEKLDKEVEIANKLVHYFKAKLNCSCSFQTITNSVTVLLQINDRFAYICVVDPNKVKVDIWDKGVNTILLTETITVNKNICTEILNLIDSTRK